jgi:thiol-disulfide isomerase/thioredoxin
MGKASRFLNVRVGKAEVGRRRRNALSKRAGKTNLPSIPHFVDNCDWWTANVAVSEDKSEMYRKLMWIVCCLAVGIALLKCSSRQTGAMVGQEAPGFRLPSLDGRQVSLSDLRGKIVLLDFWATWCGPCRLSMPQLESLQQEYAQSMVLLAINLQETPEEVRGYAHSRNLKSMVLLDSDGTVGSAYKSRSIPMQVLIDQEGVVRHVQIGYSSRMGDQLKEEINKLLP